MPNTNRQFPKTRLRRARMHSWSRELTKEHNIAPSNLIQPIFIVDGENIKKPIDTMPGIYRYSIDNMLTEIKQAEKLGIKAIMLFPVVSEKLKTPTGNEALNPNNLINRACRAIKETKVHIGIITDVALDPYTTHGHDGIIINNEIDNDATIKILAKQALLQAESGADIIAPSDMQDGRIGLIRATLESNGYKHTLVLSYATKYASNFYSPFRDAVGSSNHIGNKDKKSYQQDFANTNEALHEVSLDLDEGADLVMVKPAMNYLDIIYRVSSNFKVPTFAYQVSGEYTMLTLLAKETNSDPIELFYESVISLRRAGATAIVTYAAIELAKKLQS